MNVVTSQQAIDSSNMLNANEKNLLKTLFINNFNFSILVPFGPVPITWFGCGKKSGDTLTITNFDCVKKQFNKNNTNNFEQILINEVNKINPSLIPGNSANSIFGNGSNTSNTSSTSGNSVGGASSNLTPSNATTAVGTSNNKNLIIAIVVIIAIAGGYFFIKRNHQQQQPAA